MAMTRRVCVCVCVAGYESDEHGVSCMCDV